MTPATIRFLTSCCLAAILAGAAVVPIGAPVGATEVGVAAAVNSDAFGTPPGGARSTKVLGDNVIFNERIETTGSGLVQVLLVDGSTFTVGANSDLVIDEFVYDPGAGTGKLVATLGKGVARFVGGKLSKKRDGVTVKTPVGTIGIRGGIANLNLGGNPPVFSLLFGKDLTFTGPDGQTARIHQGGYSMEIGSGGRANVRRTRQSDLGAVQTAMSRGRQNGGISQPPNDRRIARSGIAGVNSRLANITATPRPRPGQGVGPGQPRHPGDSADALIQTQVLTQLQNVNELETETSNDVTDTARILRAGTAFAGEAALNLSPGNLGVLGGPQGFDEIVVFTRDPDTVNNGYRLWSGTADGTRIYVFDPDTADKEYFTQTVNANGSILENHSSSIIPDVPTLQGTIVQNARGQRISGEGFGFFIHFIATEPGLTPTFDYGDTDYFVGLYGDATDFDTFDGAEPVKVRTYTLNGDALTAFQLAADDNFGDLQPAESAALFLNPSIASDLGISFLGNVESTGLKIVETSSSTLEGAGFLAASLYLSAGNSTQKSFVSLGLGTVVEEDGELMLDGVRRGGHRTVAGNAAGLYGGTLASLEGPDGGTFFGDNADYLVLSPGGLTSGGTFTDGYAAVPSGIVSTDQKSGTLHVAELDTEVNLSSLSRPIETLTGYASGVLESSVNLNMVSGAPVIFNSASVGDFSIAFDGQAGTLSASLRVDDVTGSDSDIERYLLGFGDASGSGHSVYVDSDTYAAIERANGAGTQLTTDDLDAINVKSGTSPESYLIPSTLVDGADDGVFNIASKCTCDFLEWGYWGTKLEVDSASLAQGERFDTFHLGTWVAGKVTASGNLPTSGSATYQGHAVGNVINGSSQYLAAGDFAMSMNFGTRSGTATISNFDDRSMSATITEQTVASGNMFSGALSGVGGLTGQINTSIVAGPNTNHDGAIGDFRAVQGTWSATGIVAGEIQ
ncbi:FecR family protein [Roseibium sp. M-1]